MIRHALAPPVHGVERVARIRCRHDPLVMRLVQPLVDERVVQPAMDPVDAAVGEGDEERVLQVRVPRAVGGFVEGVVELRVAAYLGDEEGRGQRRHDWDGSQRLFDFLADLVAEEFGMVHLGVVEDEVVGDGGAEGVEEDGEEPVVIFR